MRTAHEDAAAASASAGKATDSSTTDLPKASEPAQGGKKAAEQRARDQEARDPRLAPAGPSLQAEPGGEQLSTATGAAEADAGTGVPAGKVEGVHGAEADHVGPGSASGGTRRSRSASALAWWPGPAARRRQWASGIAALVALIAAALVVVAQISGPECPQTASGTATFPAWFETSTESWQPNPDTPDIGCTSHDFDFATDGRYSLRIDSASTEGGWYGTQFDEPIDITGKSKVIVDMKIVDMTTLVEEGTQTAIALVFGDRGVWCQTPQPWARAKAGTDPTVTVEFDTMTLDDGSTPCREVLSSSDLTLQVVGVFFDGKGSFRIDNVRAE